MFQARIGSTGKLGGEPRATGMNAVFSPRILSAPHLFVGWQNTWDARAAKSAASESVFHDGFGESTPSSVYETAGIIRAPP